MLYGIFNQVFQISLKILFVWGGVIFCQVQRKSESVLLLLYYVCFF